MVDDIQEKPRGVDPDVKIVQEILPSNRLQLGLLGRQVRLEVLDVLLVDADGDLLKDSEHLLSLNYHTATGLMVNIGVHGMAVKL